MMIMVVKNKNIGGKSGGGVFDLEQKDFGFVYELLCGRWLNE